ncbi:putative transcription factor RfeD [Thermoascus aurantiacus ATCC 26904]
MPPRTSLTSSFSVSDANNEVVCPLTNNDGSNCRKRCLGEKRFRSMQEHIRRAHPNYYIPKLPATEESFLLMVNTPPDQRAHLQTQNASNNSRKNNEPPDRDVHVADASSPVTPRTVEETHPAAATAAVALAQLHHHRLASDWDSEMDVHSDNDIGRERMRSSIELPPLRDHLKQESLPPFQSPRPRELLPSILNYSPPGRSSTLPPLNRDNKIQRPRKSSITQSVRKPKHDRTGRRPSLGDRKALSAEPQTAAWAQGKRWEDLIEAATSATEVDDDRDLTSAPHSPSVPPLLGSATSAPSIKSRASLPPAFQSTSLPPPTSHRPFQPLSYTASPLQKALTPPPSYEAHRTRDPDLEPFPSIESSLDSGSSVSGKNFHLPVSGLARSDSSPVPPSFNTYPTSHPYQNHQRPHHRFSNPTPSSFRNREIQIYCANCSRPWPLAECYACTECICGICKECVVMFTSSPTAPILNATSSPGNGATGNGNRTSTPGPTSYPNPRGCPRCRTVGGKWKAFQLDFR